MTFVGVGNYLLCRAGSVVHHEPPSLPGHPARGVCSPHLHQPNQLDALQPTCSIWAGGFCESCSRRAHVSMPTSRRSASNSPAAAAADGLQLDDRLRRLGRPRGCILHSRLSFWDCLGPMRLPRRMDGSRTHGTFHRERISPFPACWAAGGTLAGSNGCRRSVRRRHPRRVFRMGGQYRPRPRPLDDETSEGQMAPKTPPIHPSESVLGRCPGVGRAQVNCSPAERAPKFQSPIPRSRSSGNLPG